MLFLKKSGIEPERDISVLPSLLCFLAFNTSDWPGKPGDASWPGPNNSSLGEFRGDPANTTCYFQVLTSCYFQELSSCYFQVLTYSYYQVLTFSYFQVLATCYFQVLTSSYFQVLTSSYFQLLTSSYIQVLTCFISKELLWLSAIIKHVCRESVDQVQTTILTPSTGSSSWPNLPLSSYSR